MKNKVDTNENDKLHREDGPALEDADGKREWWLNGERHRTDGPAIEDAYANREWYLNGKLVTEADVITERTRAL